MQRHSLKCQSINLPQAASFTLGLHKGEDITLAHGALHVAHDKAVLVVQELHADLGNLATAASAADDLHHDSQLDGGILHIENNKDIDGQDLDIDNY